jgi:hypothetical protein
MKTTLVIDDTVMAALRREAARQEQTVSQLVETALRRFLQSRREIAPLSPLPSFDSGGALVDVSNRGALYDIMEAPVNAASPKID